MSSLKEIKRRIISVKSTQKITSAMKMIASSKFRKVQEKRNHFMSYSKQLNEMVNVSLSFVPDYNSFLLEKRKIKRVSMVVFSSNVGFCGAFNTNLIKLLKEKIEQYKYLSPKDVEVYVIGKKAEEYIRKVPSFCRLKGSYMEWVENPKFSTSKLFVNQLISDFQNHTIDAVELLYNHCKNIVSQTSLVESYLPFSLVKSSKNWSILSKNYIIEPSPEEILDVLIPELLQDKLYTTLLDSIMAEQAARIFAMQTAVDNAGNILDDLTVQYNKQRQYVITNALLDVTEGERV